MENELFQTIDQMLLRGITIRFLKKFDNQPFGVPFEINDSVIPDMRHIVFFQLGTKNLEIGIREIVNIIGFLADRLVVCINHRKDRLHTLLVFYVLRCRNAVETVYLLVCIPEQFSFDCKPADLRLVRYASMKDLIRIVIQPHEISFPFQHGIVVDHECIQRAQIGDTDISVLIYVIHFIAFTEDTADLGQFGIVIVLIIILIQKINIFLNRFVSIVYLQFDRMPDEEAVHRIHDVFRKIDHDPVVRLPLGL